MEQKSLSIVGHNNRGDREKNDFYPTPSYATEEILRLEEVKGKILEPACGDGAIAKLLDGEVTAIDLIDRGYGKVQDYFTFKTEEKFDCVITNPPFKYALDFVKRALHQVKDSGKVIMLLKLVFLESISRYEFFKINPPKKVYVFSRRLRIYKSGKTGTNSGLVCYAWFVWEKGNKEKPVIDWINK